MKNYLGNIYISKGGVNMVYVVTDTDECLTECSFIACKVGSTFCKSDCAFHESAGEESTFYCKKEEEGFSRVLVKILEVG